MPNVPGWAKSKKETKTAYRHNALDLRNKEITEADVAAALGCFARRRSEGRAVSYPSDVARLERTGMDADREIARAAWARWLDACLPDEAQQPVLPVVPLTIRGDL
jgi:hypothetical protein